MGTHSWLNYTDKKTGESRNFSTWGFVDKETGEPKGLRINAENEWEERHNTWCLSVDITKTQYDRMTNKIDEYFRMGEKAWGKLKPCTHFSSDVFEYTTGINLQDRHLLGLGYSDPNVLYESIKQYYNIRW